MSYLLCIMTLKTDFNVISPKSPCLPVKPVHGDLTRRQVTERLPSVAFMFAYIFDNLCIKVIFSEPYGLALL